MHITFDSDCSIRVYQSFYYMYKFYARQFIFTLLILCLMLYQALNETVTMGVSLQILHTCLLNICTLTMLVTQIFNLFIVLGDELLIHFIYLTLYLGHA